MSQQAKENLRAFMQQKRAKLGRPEIIRLGHEFSLHDWVNLVAGNTVTCFASMNAEPDTSEVLKKLKSNGITTYLPIMRPNRNLAWGLAGTELTKNDFGILEPMESGFNPEDASALIIPALAVGRDGTRIGYGGGYFDRLLADLPSAQEGGPLRIAVVYDDEVFDSVPHDDWDQTINVIVTPQKTIRVRPD